jgi:hypothetical protein
VGVRERKLVAKEDFNEVYKEGYRDGVARRLIEQFIFRGFCCLL